MKLDKTASIIPGFVLLICAFALMYWFSSANQSDESNMRLPVVNPEPLIAADTQTSSAQNTSEPEQANAPGNIVPLAQGQTSVSQDVEPPALPGIWSMFRGADSDNISKERINYADDWSQKPPKTIWSMDAGEGHAGAAVRDSRVYILDYDRDAQADVLRCLALADGKQLWSYSYPVSIKRNHGMSRTVPAVDDKYVVTIGPLLDVVCADAKSGQVYWTKNLVKEYGAAVPPWYAGQCPLIDSGKLIIAPSGPKVLMTALDLATGKALWQAANNNAWTMTHSSVIPANILGKRTYIYCGSGGVVGISASDGKILWETKEWKVRIATVPSPLPVSTNNVFLSGGYNSGSMMIQLSNVGGAVQVKSLYKLQPKVFGSDQQTPILNKNFIYGVIPSGQLVCMNLDGTQVWDSGSDRFGLGPYVAAGNKLFVLADNGVLSMVELNSNGYKKLGQIKVLFGPDAWGPIAVAGNRLIMRDLTKLICLEIPVK